MRKALVYIMLQIILFSLSSFHSKEETTFQLIVKVKDLRNTRGIVQFTLYNDADSFPDEHYKKYYRKLSSKIVNGTSTVIFENVPAGRYAVNILHDEDEDGQIKKGIILPKEGIGFSNYQSIGPGKKPAFNKAAFDLSGNKELDVKIIYLKK